MVDQTTHPPKCHSFVGLDRQIGSSPPALDLKRERTEGRKREKFYIYLDVTHTHNNQFQVELATTGNGVLKQPEMVMVMSSA